MRHAQCFGAFGAVQSRYYQRFTRHFCGRFRLHLGLTEAGMGSKGIVASTAALAVLLQEGIGDTIRISLTPEPGGDRTQEVVVAQEILRPWACAHSPRW